MQEIFANLWVGGLSSFKSIRVQEIFAFHEFWKIRKIRENYLHAKICCSTVVVGNSRNGKKYVISIPQ